MIMIVIKTMMITVIKIIIDKKDWEENIYTQLPAYLDNNYR